MSTKNRTRRTTTRNIRFPNQMIEQINIALEQKGSGNFSAWVIEACRRRLCSEKRVSPEANKEKSDITELLRKQVRPDWSNLDNRADYAPSYHMEGLSMDQVVIFKQIFDKVRNDLNYQWFYSELKRHNVSHYIYYLATENVHIVLKNDNTVLLKGLKNIVSVKFSKDRHLIETTSNKLKSREITFQEYRRNLAKAGVFRWVTNIHEQKRYYYTFDNSLLFTENIQSTSQMFPH